MASIFKWPENFKRRASRDPPGNAHSKKQDQQSPRSPRALLQLQERRSQPQQQSSPQPRSDIGGMLRLFRRRSAVLLLAELLFQLSLLGFELLLFSQRWLVLLRMRLTDSISVSRADFGLAAAFDMLQVWFTLPL